MAAGSRTSRKGGCTSTHSPPACRPISAPCLPRQEPLLVARQPGHWLCRRIDDPHGSGHRRHAARRLQDSRIRPNPRGTLAARQHHRVRGVSGERLSRACDGRRARGARGARSGDGGGRPFADDGAWQSAAADGPSAWRGRTAAMWTSLRTAGGLRCRVTATCGPAVRPPEPSAVRAPADEPGRLGGAIRRRRARPHEGVDGPSRRGRFRGRARWHAPGEIPAEGAPADLVWVTRSGTTTSVPGQAREMTPAAFGLAPDGGRALMSMVGPDFREEIVVRDLATGTDTRVPPPRPVSAMTQGANCLVGAWRAPVLRRGRRRDVRDLRLACRRIDRGPQARRGHQRANGGGPSGDLLHARRARCDAFAPGDAATRRAV